VDVTAEEGIKGPVPPADEMELLCTRPFKLDSGAECIPGLCEGTIELVERR
jgi:hypothetical protein